MVCKCVKYGASDGGMQTLRVTSYKHIMMDGRGDTGDRTISFDV